MEKAGLDCSKRVLAGKKVRFLRRKGIIPANVYGHGIESTAVQCQDKDLEAIIKGGTARLIMLVVDGETEKRNVLIKNVDRHPLNRSLLHADFYQVKMTEKMTTEKLIEKNKRSEKVSDSKEVVERSVKQVMKGKPV